MVTGFQCPPLILSSVYLLRVSSLTAAFLVLFNRDGENFSNEVLRTIQICLAGQCLSAAPIVHWSLKRSEWPQPNWSLISIEVAKNITLISLWMLFIFCAVLLVGAPADNLHLTLQLTSALASLILPTLVANYSLSKFGRKMRLIDRLMLTPLPDCAEMSFLKLNSISVLFSAWFAGLALYLDWQDEWKVYPVANILLSIFVSIICNCIYLSISSVSLVQKWTNY